MNSVKTFNDFIAGRTMETTFTRVGDAMAYLEGEYVADLFNTTEDGDIAAYWSSEEGSIPTAIIYEGVNGVRVEYRK